MEKAKKIISQAESNVAEAKKAVAGSNATVQEAKLSMATERSALSMESDPASVQEKRKAVRRKKTVEPCEKANRNRLDFPIVGIGASAGGLEALQTFFEHITSPLDVAFVIVQHLSPDHNSYMSELLGRYTSIPVDFIKDGMPVKVNHIYLIPPKVNIFIHDGILYHSPITERCLNLPIDIFFRSLAEDQQSNAVAIILSGAGSDGTLGIRAIKEYGGIAMVQDPIDAKFDGMPKSAISTDMVDLVRSSADLANELISNLGHPLFTHPRQKQRLKSKNQTQYDRILSMLKSAKKVDFTSYRRETITRRLEKRISINRFSNLTDYVDFLSKTPQEVDTLFHEILIGVTRFFRDPEAFGFLEKNCFPDMFRNLHNGELRIWVASCSTGEEAYSVAILLKDYMLKNRIVADVKIFATDIDDRSLKFAATGFYPQNVVSDIPPQYLAKYFSPRGNGYLVNQDIRKMIIFASQDLIDNPPFFKLDLVTCRNFLIYIGLEAQQRVLSSFYVGLKPGAFLFLGSSESLEELSKGFETLGRKEKIFRKIDGYTPKNYSPRSPMPLHLSLLEHPRGEAGSSISRENSELLSILEQIDDAFLQPSLVIDSNNDIIYAIRDGGKLLHISSGRVTTNLLKILQKDLGLIVSSIIRRSEGRSEVISGEMILDGKPTIVRCKHIVPECSGKSYFYLSFEEIVPGKGSKIHIRSEKTDLSGRYQERIDELEDKVHQQKESLKIAVEQLETSNEELQASNEELVASNEELQSSNEELQSVNEELYTVNIEHVRKLEEITELNCDYDNLLSNTQIGTFFLDSHLVIRKISKIAGELTGIMQNDIGRPLSYFSLRKLYPKFIRDVEKVNISKKMIEKELHLRGKTFCMRIVPYLAEDKNIKGIIVSFVDLTECKMRALQEAYDSQAQIRTSTAQLEAAADIAKMDYFQINVETGKCTGGKMLPKLLPIQESIALRPEEWICPEDVAEVNDSFQKILDGKILSVQLSFRSSYFGELSYYRVGMSLGVGPSGEKVINGVIQNTTGVIRAQQERDAQKQWWEDSINAVPVLFYAKDAENEFRYVFANRFFLEFTGKRLDEIVGKTDEEIVPSGRRFLEEDQLALKSGSVLETENEVIMPDGGIRYFHTVKRLHIGMDGRRLIMGIGSDVTEQRLTMQDMQIANQCLAALAGCVNFSNGIREIMKTFCERLGALYCFWLSIDYDSMTVKCEREYVHPECGEKLFGKSVKMPFTGHEQWYECLASGKVLDIPDVSKSAEAKIVLKKYCSSASVSGIKSICSIGIRPEKVLIGSVGYFFAGIRPKISAERFAYLMTSSANLFGSALQMRKRFEK